METQLLEKRLKEKITESIRLVRRGVNRFVVLQPFAFDDGDHFVVILHKEGAKWTITDEGHTLMHVQYDDLDLSSGTRARILSSTLSTFSVENARGELKAIANEEDIGDALFSYLQALNKISDLDFLTREIVRSTFMEDVRDLVENLVPESRRHFDYHDEHLDPKGNYSVDCRINGKKRPEFVFFIPNDFRCHEATIVCHQFERWKKPFRATGMFEDMAGLNSRAVAQFADIAYKSIPTLGSDYIGGYFEEIVQEV